MESWRERGFVPDSDEEDGFDSQETVKTTDNVADEVAVAGDVEDLPASTDSSSDDDELGSDTPIQHRIHDRIGAVRENTSEGLAGDISSPRRQDPTRTADFSQTLSDAHDPSPPATPQAKPQKDIWDIPTSSPDELQLDFLPPRQRTAAVETAQPDSQPPQEYGQNNGPIDDISSLSSPLSSIHSLSLDETEEDAQGRPALPLQDNFEDVLAPLDLPEEVLRELSQPARRSLRQRNPIQLHPYLLEDAKYRRLMQQGGIKPVRIAQYQAALRAAAANASQNGEYDDGVEPPSSSPAVNHPGLLSPSSVAARRAADDEPPNNRLRRPNRRPSELPSYSPGGTRYRAQKRRKVSRPVEDDQLEQLRRMVIPQVVIDTSPSTRMDSDSVFDNPLSPSRSGSVSSPQPTHSKEFRFPRGFSPPPSAVPVKRMTTARRGSNDDEDVDAMDWSGPMVDQDVGDVQSIHSQSEHNSDEEQGNESDEQEEEQSGDENAVQELRRRIKGVLPASWLRLDQQKQTRDRLNSTQRNRDSRPENTKGVARKLNKRSSTKPSSPKGQLTSLRELADDSSDGSADNNAGVDSRQELARLVGFDDPFMDEDMGDDILEDNRIDYMFPSHPRGPSVSRTKRSTTKQSTQGGSDVRFTDGFKRPRHKRQARLTDPIYSTRREPRRSHSPAMLGILDAPDVASKPRKDQPQFLRVAARNARSRRDRGRRGPSRKVFQLSSRADTEDANASLRQWRRGKLRQTRLSGYQTKLQERQPLVDRPSNQKETLGSLVAREISKTSRTQDGSTTRPQEDRDANTRLGPETSVPTSVPGNSVSAANPTGSYRQGHNWIVRRDVSISSLKRNAHRPAVSDLVGGTHTTGFQKSLSTLNRGHRNRRLSKSRDGNVLLDRFLNPSTQTKSHNTRLANDAPVLTQSDDMLPTARYQIRRPQIRKRPPRRIDLDAPERQETIAPSFLEDEPFNLVDEDAPSLARYGKGLSGYRRSYTIDFNITPLQPGTFYHESTFIGSGEFSRSLALGKRDLDRSATIFQLRVGTMSFRWGSWNDTVSSELGIAFNTMLEEIERSHVSAEEPTESTTQETCALYRSLLKYCSDSIGFIDPVDRIGFIRRAHGLASRVNDTLAALSRVHKTQAGLLTRISAYNLVFANQAYQVSCHDIVTEAIRKEAIELVQGTARQVGTLLSDAAAQTDIRKLLNENKSQEKRDAGIREDHPAVDAYVIAYHVLQPAEIFKGSFEMVCSEACSISDVSDKGNPRNISWLEDRWYQMFTMLPLNEIDASGISRIGSRFRITPDSWTIPECLARPVLDSYDPKSATPISYNNYCRALFHRCFHLINAWGWRDCKRILDTLYDFFAKNTLYNLEHEESFGSPSFLDELDRSPSLDIKLGEPCFHVLLKIIASGLRFLAQRYDKKKIRNFGWRLLPNHGRVYPKEKPLQQTDLAALRNHHDLLCTLYFAVPDGCRPRLEAIKNLVDPASSHRETCNISLRSWIRLVRFKLSTNEDVSGLEQFADWHAYFVNELLKQHGLARREIEAQNTGGNQFSHQLIERTISENQRHIESLLKFALTGLQSAIKSAPMVQHAEKLAHKAALAAVLGLFNPRVSRVNTTVSEALQVILAYLEKCNYLSTMAPTNQPVEEDSQEYGDWTAIEALYGNEMSTAPPPGIELVEKVFHPEVSRLMSNCFGEDYCPEDAMLLNVVECWASIAHTLVKHKLRHWDSYLSPYNSDSWAALRSTTQTRKYTPKFLASCVEKDTSFVAECRVHVYSIWMSSLMERSSMLKFQHSLTEALLNGDTDNPMLQNLPFYRDPIDGQYSVTLEEISQRRLSLISSVLSNMCSHVLQLEDMDSRDLSSTKQEYRELVQRMMLSMKANYQELGSGTAVAQSDYVDFVHRVVGFLQQYTRDICPVDHFFTDPSSFPLPLDDPTYIVARVKSYEPKLSSGKSAKALIVFIQSASERAAIDRRQTYFVEQLHASMEEAYESGDAHRPTLRAFLFQSAFPAYLEVALSSPAGWILSRPIIETISLTSRELLFNMDATDPRCVSSLVEIFSSIFRSSYHALMTVVDNIDLLKEPPVVLIVSSMIEMITSALRVVDYIDRATAAGGTLVSQVHVFRQIFLFIASHIHGCPLSDFTASTEVFTNELPAASKTSSVFRVIGQSATRELQAYINESWSRHQGKYYFTRRGCHQPQEVQMEPSIAARLQNGLAGFDDATDMFLETLEALDMFGDGEQRPSPVPSPIEDTVPYQEKAADSKPRPVPPILDYWWGWDILGLTLALAVLIAIIVILRVYDGKQQPSWRWISLNTLLSWLSTVGKGCIALPLSTGLSQLKWVWFAQKKRPMSDLRVFDNASRGIYGSAELLWALRMRHFAVFGAIAVLLAIGFEPFVQNLVHYSSDLVVDTSKISRLANATNYSGLGPLQSGAVNYYIEPTLKGNIYNSIFSTDPGRPWTIPQHMCPTGNCTWDPVASLAVRALCANVTSSIEESCEALNDGDAPYNNCTVSLPNGTSAYYASGYHTEAIALQVQPVDHPIVYTNATLPVIQRIEAVVASSEDGWTVAQEVRDNPIYVATECSLEPIVRSIKASVNSSVYHETVLAEWSNVEVWYDRPLVPDWNESLGVYPGQNFTLSSKSQATITQFMKSLFSGNAYASTLNLEFSTIGLELHATPDVMEAFMYGNITGCADIERDRFGCAMRNVADAMSKSFRDQAYVNAETDMLAGHTQVNATIVHIHWQWLTLPLLVWLLSAVTWLGTEWKTRRGKLQKWSDNPLPLLFLYRSVEESETDEVQGVSGQAYERRAKSIHVQLYTNEEQAVFVK
ncbi:Mus7/MMS22 family-domain-containing protein [Aspergillus ambiguus]|uniref:uncharacterized protein n=1 Tax=Aspergillus ambiguus TaxID=176160 RepID=UPI003CCD7DE6